jgi:hypothetical protein
MLISLVTVGTQPFEKTPDVLQVKLVGNDGITWLTALSWLGTVVVTLWALYQWDVSRRVARMQYLDDRMKLLRENPSIVSATQLLDYDGGLITLNGKPYAYSVRELPRALMPHDLLPSGEIFSAKEKAIRDAFDAFFDYLDGVAYAVQLGIISKNDVLNSSIEYYLHKMHEKQIWTARWAEFHAPGKAEGVMTRYLKSYRLDRALALFESYLRPPRWWELGKKVKYARPFTDKYAAKVDESFAKAEAKLAKKIIPEP